MERIYSFIIMVLAIAALSAAQAGSLYKWVDGQGRVSYHDQPPPEGAGYRFEEKNIDSGRKTESGSSLAKIAEKNPVILYTVPACGSCDLARLYLQKRKIPFTEQNVEKKPELQQMLKKKTGSLSAPTITIGEKVMVGYVESILEGELNDAGYPKIKTYESPEDADKENNEEATSAPNDSGVQPDR